MAINLAKEYITILDEKFTLESKTAILDTPNVMEGRAANEVLVPKRTISGGLSDYNKATGYTAGTVDLVYETLKLTQDKGKKLTIDRIDNIETLDVAFTGLAGQFIKEVVTPAVDVYRFKKLSTLAGNTEEETLTDATVLAAIDAGTSTMFDAEVSEDGNVLFVSINTYNLMKQNTKMERSFSVQMSGPNMDRRIEMFDGMPIIKVPSNRFLADDDTVMNFMIVNKANVIQIVKLANLKIISADENQTLDANEMQYRLYHDLFILDNKVNAVYVSKPAAIS